MRVILAAIDSKSIHKSPAPWSLKAWCDGVAPGAFDIRVAEYTVNEDPAGIVDDLYARRPDAVGFSCYIWNIETVAKVAVMLRRFLPDCVVVLGGPEVSFDEAGAYPFADYVVRGAGERALAGLLQDLAAGAPPEKGVLEGEAVDFAAAPTPLTPAYFDSFAAGKMADIRNQLVYYESVRGCPFSCAYCLSSAREGVRCLPEERVAAELDRLAACGAAVVKFVDRTFNADRKRASAILRHIRGMDTACTFHFEVAADLFDEELFAVLEAMPAGRVQFEAGIQSVDPAALAAVSRKTDTEKALENIARLAAMGNCHIHADLIAGLPHDTPGSFREAVDRCLAARPHMLQIGFLKLLKGSPLRRQAEEMGYVYNPFPPYQVFSSPWMSFEEIRRLKRLDAVVDKFYNSGLFAHATAYGEALLGSPCEFCEELAGFCEGRSLKIAVKNAYALMLEFLTAHGDPGRAEHAVRLDCFAFHDKCALPDSLRSLRDREAERAYRAAHPEKSRVRAERFPLDGVTRVFCYDERHPVTRAFAYEEAAAYDQLA